MSWPKNVTLIPVIPPMQDYIEYERPAGWDEEEDGGNRVPLDLLDEALARGYAELWRAAFMSHWRKARAAAGRTPPGLPEAHEGG